MPASSLSRSNTGGYRGLWVTGRFRNRTSIGLINNLGSLSLEQVMQSKHRFVVDAGRQDGCCFCQHNRLARKVVSDLAFVDPSRRPFRNQGEVRLKSPNNPRQQASKQAIHLSPHTMP